MKHVLLFMIHFQTVAAANNYWRDSSGKEKCTCGNR